jgi:peptidoglycan-associated lipoprotein
MSSLFRLRHLAVAPALILALGCSSTSSPPSIVEQTESQTTAVSDTMDSRVDISQVSAELRPVYFDTAVAELGTEATATLKAYAKSILDHPEWGVLRIEGHCDERGSNSYNLALGKRRAAAVEHRLIEMGVAPSRLVTRTFGERNPAVRGHDERAWRHNRRSELRAEDVLASTNR